VKFAFRVDASAEIGSGHVMRCLTLADLLRERGHECRFHCHPQQGDRIAAIQAQGYPVTPVDLNGDLPGPHDWLVVDQYRLDAAWEARQPVARRLVIDDLADRPHHCDLLLDQNLRADAEARYRPLVPAHCRLLLGPAHVLLRPDFDCPPRPREGQVRHVLAYFGGNDQDNQAGRALEALRRFPRLSAEIVLGPDHPHRDAVHAASVPGLTVRDACPDMAAAMQNADLALGVCGIAAWERCALGLPTLVCVTADNQREDAIALHRLGAVEHLGESADVDAERWAEALARALADPARIARMGEAAAAVVAGHQENRTALLELLHGV
jgi:UDP-2,4-diacetamido-2,4,6-trideoxy-beta-L-altropyranose hydrolase